MKINRLSMFTFCYATEDEERIKRALSGLIEGAHQGVQLHREELSGHYGDPIISLKVELEGESATEATKAIMRKMETTDLIFLISTINDRVQGSKVYLRIDKQGLISKGKVFLKEGEDAIKLVISIKDSKERFVEELKTIVSRNVSTQ